MGKHSCKGCNRQELNLQNMQQSQGHWWGLHRTFSRNPLWTVVPACTRSFWKFPWWWEPRDSKLNKGGSKKNTQSCCFSDSGKLLEEVHSVTVNNTCGSLPRLLFGFCLVPQSLYEIALAATCPYPNSRRPTGSFLKMRGMGVPSVAQG